MRKHEISYHDKSNTIEFILDFCIHSETNKEKNIRIVIKILSRKESKSNNLSRKDYKSNQSERIILSESESSFKETSKNSKSKIDVSAVNIAMIEVFAFNMMSKKKNVNLFSITLKNVKKHFEKASKLDTISKDVLSSEYHDFLNVFDKKTFNTLASHRSYDHKTILKKNAISDYISLYNMFEEELKIIKKYLKNNLKKEFITISKSSFVFSIMFMKKTNKSLRFCVNYKKLNQLTKKNRYSLSLIVETLTHLKKAQYFTKLNIKQTFHRIKIANSKSKDLITFRIKFDAYKYQVLSFELCNESIIYQHYMNNVFFDYLNYFVSIYIDNILIYYNSKTKHVKYVKKVLQRLQNAELQANINKCEFFVHETKYLRLIVERDKIKMNSFKIKTILQ